MGKSDQPAGGLAVDVARLRRTLRLLNGSLDVICKDIRELQARADARDVITLEWLRDRYRALEKEKSNGTEEAAEEEAGSEEIAKDLPGQGILPL